MNPKNPTVSLLAGSPGSAFRGSLNLYPQKQQKSLWLSEPGQRKRILVRKAFWCTSADFQFRSGVTQYEIIDTKELALRWRVPESWVRAHSRLSCPEDQRIPCVRFGRYVRFRWGSPELCAWIEKHCK
jgi:hypothetical protein